MNLTFAILQLILPFLTRKWKTKQTKSPGHQEGLLNVFWSNQKKNSINLQLQRKVTVQKFAVQKKVIVEKIAVQKKVSVQKFAVQQKIIIIHKKVFTAL